MGALLTQRFTLEKVRKHIQRHKVRSRLSEVVPVERLGSQLQVADHPKALRRGSSTNKKSHPVVDSRLARSTNVRAGGNFCRSV